MIKFRNGRAHGPLDGCTRRLPSLVTAPPRSIHKEKHVKTFIALSAGLLIGTAAVAQGSMSQPTAPNITDGSPPERDARGIPVISAPAVAPPGANAWVPMQTGMTGMRAVPAPNQAMVFAARQPTQSYPACTATVTDNCVQAYVSSNRRQMSRR